MPTPTPDRIRTVAVVGHSHDGKTTLCEALLHTAGATQRMGSTEQGTSLFDHEPEEQRHSMSIGLSIAHCDWDGTRVNLLDAPGFQDFAGEVVEALAVADAAVLVVAATGTVQVGAEMAWEMIQAAGVPALIVVNRMDKENAAYEATVDALREAFSRKPIAVAVPIGAADGFRGYVDLVDDRAHEFDDRGRATDAAVPDEMSAEIERAHAALVDAAAESDDALLEKYLEGTELTDEEVRTALHAATARGTLVPIVCASAATEKGAAMVLDSIIRYLPAPTERTRTGLDAKDNDVAIACDPDGKLCRLCLQDHRRHVRQGVVRQGAARHLAWGQPSDQPEARPGGALRATRPAQRQVDRHSHRGRCRRHRRGHQADPHADRRHACARRTRR